MEVRDLIVLFPRHTDKQVNTSGEAFFLNGEQFMLCENFDMHSALLLVNFCCTYFFCYNFSQNCLVYDQGILCGTEQERISFLIEK